MITRPKLFPRHLSTESAKENDFSCISIQELKGNQVFVSLKKHQLSHLAKKENISEPVEDPCKRYQSPKNNERKTIQSTIKELLKGKQDLFNYLESEKQFIQILDVHDHKLRHLHKNRGKLTSSLTQKKKSRIDTYSNAKNTSISHFSEFPSRKNKQKKKQIQALTMEVLTKQTQPHQIEQKKIIQKRQYQTVSFDNICSEENQKYHPESQKIKCQRPQDGKSRQNPKKKVILCQKQNKIPSDECFLMTSPKKKHLKLSEKSNFDQNYFYATKYGLTHFSPWAFGKNEYDSELGENESILLDVKYSKALRENVSNSEAKPIRLDPQNQNKKRQSGRRQHLKQKNTNIQKETITSDNEKSYLKNQTKYRQTNDFKSKQGEKEKENFLKNTIQTISNGNQNFLSKQYDSSIENEKSETNQLKNCGPNIKVVKSSQVVILQSGTINSSEIFASKEHAKQMFHQRKFQKNQSNQEKQTMSLEKASIFQTEINIFEGEKCNCPLSKQNSQKVKSPEMGGSLTQKSDLCEMKKTEEFLKEIILTKNSVSYANSRSISKKEFKKINQAIYEEESSRRSNVFMTKNLLEKKVYSQKSPRTKQFYSVSHYDKKSEKESRNSDKANSSLEKENVKNDLSEKKAKTSLGNRLCQKNVNEFIESSNIKCLTETSLNGFYLLNESKNRNTKNSFVRRKRHSMLVKKKSSNGNKTKQQNPHRRFSYSTQKQIFNSNIHDFSILEESKGFGIINPLTKQLYKKYVSIVQSKRY